MGEISNDNREAERQRIEQAEKEQRRAEEARSFQEQENAKALQAEDFSPGDDSDVSKDDIAAKF